MPTELTHLTLTELSLVDRPANPLAMAPIFKADTSNGEDMTETTEKMAPEMEAKIKAYMKDKGVDRKTAMAAMSKAFDEAQEVETLKADLEKAKTENERLRKGLLDGGYIIKADTIEKKAEPEYIEYDGEKINKADVPAVILKKLEEAEFEKRETAIAKSAKEKFPHMKEDLAVALVKADFDEDLMAALAALDEMFGEQMDEIGKSSSSDGDMSDPHEKLNALAKSYSAEHKVTFAKAYSEVVKTDAGKALTKEIYKKD